MPSLRVSCVARTLLAFLAVTLVCKGTAAQTKFKVLYNFKGPPDAAAPWAGVTLNEKGDLYGTTPGGGTGKCGGGCGTVYKLTRQAGGVWTEKVVHSFKNANDFVFGGLVGDGLGDLYGTTGGTDILFELTNRGTWREFTLPDGGSNSTLLAGAPGHLYGPGGGGVFELTRGALGWKQKVLYQFQCGSDGCGEVWSVVSDAKGNLYGTTKFGGNYPPMCSGSAGCGTVFELTPEADGRWREQILHSFAQFKDDGQLPFAGLVLDSEGNLYGTTYEGGAYQTGTVFQLTPQANGEWRETILFDFPRNEDGGGPIAAMAFDPAGTLYGTTVYGGTQACSCGVVFKLAPAAGGKRVYSVLHRFSRSDGASPYAGVTLDSRGNLYGTTLSGGTHAYGVVYEVTP